MSFSSLVLLGDVSQSVMGQAPPSMECNKQGYGTPFVKAGEFGTSRPVIKEWTTKPLKMAKHSDVLLCVVGATCGKINLGEDCSIGRSVAAIRPDEKRLDQKYLYYFLRSWSERLRKLSQGAAQTVITREMIANMEIPLPPLAEQQRIAAILDKADALRYKRQQAIDLADRFLRSVFMEMFGDPVSNPKGWPTLPLKDLSRVVTGNTPSRKEPENYGSGIEWIKSDNINTPHHYLTEAEECLSDVGLKKGRSVSGGSVLITCIAGSPQCIGNASIADRKVAFNQQINALVPNSRTTTEYLYSLALFGKKLIQGASTNSMKGMVSKGNLENLKVPVPPVEMQERYSEIFKDFLVKRQRQSSSLEQYERFFCSLSQKAFRDDL